MIESIVNFRDFGGLSSRFGGRVARDRLYRSGAPASIRAPEIERLLGLDFALIADLRYAGEREHEPSPWPIAYAERVLAHDGGIAAEAPHMAPLRDGTMDEAECDRIYVGLYRSLPFDSLYQPLLADVLGALPQLDGRFLVHCSAGKDRTGMAVALVHHALGVPREEIFANFLISSTAPGLLAMVEPMSAAMSARYGWEVRPALMRALLDVREHWLAAFFEEIEARAGSVDAYLDGIGLTADRREAMRARLLEG